MTLPNLSGRRLSALVTLAAVVAALPSCELPVGGIAAVRGLQGFGELTGGTVKRAESASGSNIFSGARSLGVPSHNSSINDMARMLAGMPASLGRDSFEQTRSTGAWQSHRAGMDTLWATFSNKRAGPISSWAAREIPDLRRANAVFYPFSGPDILFAKTFFPSAETYILVGLEGAEPLPPITSLGPSDIASGLQGLRHAIHNVMQFSYFITADMKSDLTSTRFRGVLPIMMAFLARTGHTIDSVDTIRLDGSGTPVMVRGSSANGLQIRCRTGMGRSVRVFYFKQDLSNGSMRNGHPLLNFVSRNGSPPAFVKSASYLMHDSGFSAIRNYLLSGCRGIVQGPSGVPYRYFRQKGWDLNLYGNYTGTLNIFSAHHQSDLVSAYRAGAGQIPQLDFGIGYLYSPSNTCLMVGRR